MHGTCQFCLLFFWGMLIFSCKEQPRPASPDSPRCTAADVGDVSKLISTAEIQDDRMVRVQGITDPRSLMWRDKVKDKSYYVARILGSEQRVFFIKQLLPGEQPAVLAEVEGYLLRWDRLPDSLGGPLTRAVQGEFGIQVKPELTYLINASGKPIGCP